MRTRKIFVLRFKKGLGLLVAICVVGAFLYWSDSITSFLRIDNIALIFPTITGVSIYLLKKMLEAPVLIASYSHNEPMVKKNTHAIPSYKIIEDKLIRDSFNAEVYDFHFLVENFGFSSANYVVADIVELWEENKSGELVKDKTWLPVPLRYHKNEFVQQVHRRRTYYWPEDFKNQPVRNEYIWDDGSPTFRLDLWNPPSLQIRLRIDRVFGIKIFLYGENVKPEVIYLKIMWDGKWHDEKKEMFERIKIKQYSSIKTMRSRKD